MRKPQGQLTISHASGAVEEHDTVTCPHCNCVVVVKGKDVSELGGFCRQCMRQLCNKKKCNESCTPFEKKLELWERRAALLRHVTGSD